MSQGAKYRNAWGHDQYLRQDGSRPPSGRLSPISTQQEGQKRQAVL